MTDAQAADLRLDQDDRFERRMQRVHRVANVVAVLLLAAALLGIFGEGPLAHVTRRAGGVTLSYDRFVRTAASTFLQIQLPGHGGTARVAISNGYSNALSIGQVNPQPQQVTSLPDRTVYEVKLGRSGTVQIYVVPETIGLHGGTVWAAGQRISFHQFVYP